MLVSIVRQPVRKKYLASAQKEYAKSVESISKIALLFPSIAFKVMLGLQAVVQWPATTTMEERLAQIFRVSPGDFPQR